MINITIAHIVPALAAYAASVELHASAPCRLVQCDFRRLTIVGLVAPPQSTAVLSAGHGAPTPPRQSALSPGNSDLKRLTSVGLVALASGLIAVHGVSVPSHALCGISHASSLLANRDFNRSTSVGLAATRQRALMLLALLGVPAPSHALGYPVRDSHEKFQISAQNFG